MALTRTYSWQAPMVGDAAERHRGSEARIRLGFVGLGLMGNDTLKLVTGRSDVTVAALCDVDSRRVASASERLREVQDSDSFTCFADFRELNRSDAVDALVISTPDHWHAVQAIDAMRSRPMRSPWSLD